ncbi:MAG: DUF4129 domain-containing protein [Pseudomonadota bacterium]
MQLTDSGRAYLEAAGRWVQGDVAYFDPSRAAPPLETRAEPETADAAPTGPQGGGLQAPEIPLILLSLVVLVGAGVFFWRNRGSVAVSFRRSADNPSRPKAKPAMAVATGNETAPLAGILSQKNRQTALILLARRVLDDVVAANDLLLQDSWTARDAIRRLPAAQNHLDALKALVLAAEGAQFGDRPVSDAEFDAHLEGVRPLLHRQAA